MEYSLYHGDCLEVMATLAAQSVDCICADPPYGTTSCAWDSVIPFVPMWENIKRVIKPRGAVVLFGSQPFTSALVMSNPKWFKYQWVWEKDKTTGFLDSATRPLKAHEDIVVFGDLEPVYSPQKSTGHKPSNRGGKGDKRGKINHGAVAWCQTGGSTERYPRTVIGFDVVNNMHNPVHPTQKPVDLLAYLVKTYTNPGDTVLDFTMGSGTTGVACAETGRNFIGIELDPGYFAIAQERVEAAYRKAQGLPRKGKATDTLDLPLFA